MRHLAPAFAFVCLALAGCSSRADEGAVSVAVIGSSDGPFETGNRLSPAGQLVREATSESLVAMNQQGEIVPAIAESWIFTEDGLSYFFRIRNSEWSDGDRLNAASVRAALMDRIRSLQGTSLGLDLSKIAEIRVMAERVLEIRLKAPSSDLLQLLAQPELGLQTDGQGTGPMRKVSEEADDHLRLQPIPPELRGLPQRRDWDANVLDVVVRGMSARRAVDAFSDGEADVVLNGRLSTLPMADVGLLSGGSLRLDAAVGLFALSYRNRDGLLATAERREALSMAINRDALLQPFNVAGWEPSTRVVPDALFSDRVTAPQRWDGQSLEQRRRIAESRISAWKREENQFASLTIALPEGPGSNLLFTQLKNDFDAVGVLLTRAKPDEAADLALIDRLARYASPRWFLNQFNCDIAKPICSPDADVLVDQSLYAATEGETEVLLAQAEQALIEAEAFIPLGAPLRWSLVRGGIDGFSENLWGRHPLFPMATAPIS